MHCEADRVMTISGKCSDNFCASIGDKEYDGYVPDDIGVGSDDYINFKFCLECGFLQGEYPLKKTSIEKQK